MKVFPLEVSRETPDPLPAGAKILGPPPPHPRQRSMGHSPQSPRIVDNGASCERSAMAHQGLTVCRS